MVLAPACARTTPSPRATSFATVSPPYPGSAWALCVPGAGVSRVCAPRARTAARGVAQATRRPYAPAMSDPCRAAGVPRPRVPRLPVPHHATLPLWRRQEPPSSARSSIKGNTASSRARAAPLCAISAADAELPPPLTPSVVQPPLPSSRTY
jgi:hypothetical protein